MMIPDILKNVLGLKETRLRHQRLKKGGDSVTTWRPPIGPGWRTHSCIGTRILGAQMESLTVAVWITRGYHGTHELAKVPQSMSNS